MHNKFKIEIRAQLQEPTGKIIKTLPWVKANSLLVGFIRVLLVQMSQVFQGIIYVNGITYNMSAEAQAFRVIQVARQTASGIVIGTGTTPVTIDDYKLEAQVTANITHPSSTFSLENPDASTYRVAISRLLTNATGAVLGIREVALYMDELQGVSPICLDHTLYSVDVPNGISVTLTYRITISL